MCSCISRSERLAAVFCATLCLLLAGAGCSAAALSPAECGGYAVAPADDASKQDARWAGYLRDHLRRRAEGGIRTVPDEGTGDRELFGLTVRIDTLLKGDFCVERSRRGVLIAARDERTMLWLQYQLMKSLAGEDRRIDAADLPPAAVGLRDTAGRFAFAYRAVYTPAAQDDDLAGILSTDNVETGWGLWGHQLDRALADAPKEVFATVGGETCDGQFCFSSDETFRRIEKYVADNFGEGGTLPARFVIARETPSMALASSVFSHSNFMFLSLSPAFLEKSLGKKRSAVSRKGAPSVFHSRSGVL